MENVRLSGVTSKELSYYILYNVRAKLYFPVERVLASRAAGEYCNTLETAEYTPITSCTPYFTSQGSGIITFRNNNSYKN